jgi:hypothetical protein
MAKGILSKLMDGVELYAKSAADIQYIQPYGGSFSSASNLGIGTGLPTPEAFFFGGDGRDYRFTWGQQNPAMSAYLTCPPLAAVLNRKAQAYLNGVTRFYNTQHKEITNPSPGSPVAGLMKLLNRPNAIQTWKQFEAQQYLYVQLYGWCICMPVFPAGFSIKNGMQYASALWNIPPFMVDVVESNSLFYQQGLKGVVESIKLNYKNQQQFLDLDSIYIFRDFVPSFKSIVFPGSRLQPLAMNINNIIAAYESRNELINYAGSQGILSPPSDQSGPVPIKKADREQLQADFKRQYGIRRGQSRYIISNASLNWAQMGRPTKDLMLFEEVVDDIMRICDALNFPSPLINTDKGPTLANTDAFKEMLYTDGIIPESQDLYEQWNEFLDLDSINIEMCKEYDHLPVFQEDKADNGRAALYLNQALQIQWLSDQITWNEWRTANGMDTVAGRDFYYTQGIAEGLITPSGAMAQQQAQSDNYDNNANNNSNGNSNS